MDVLEYDDRPYSLQRFPLHRDDPLRAWDAADEYLLAHLREQPAGDGKTILLVNDAFGALGTALHGLRPDSWSDSHLSRLALAHNLELNDLPPDAVRFVPGDADPDGAVDLVLLKLPKSLVWLEDSLLRLRPCLRAGSRVIAGGMIKHTPRRAYELLERHIGPTTTSLGRRKARLAFSEFDPDLERPADLPSCVYTLEGFDLELSNRANVFSRERIDLGTRLLLDHLPRTDAPLRAADLGCGNGALGLALALRCPAAAVLFTDESYQAIADARENAARAGLADRDLDFIVADGLRDVPAASLDLIVCNPPFHQAQAVGDLVAWRMFEQARRVLRPGGELRVVGNRHLGYHVKLKRLFGGCEVVGSDRKFVVLRAGRRG